jgi:hypothetical protein
MPSMRDLIAAELALPVDPRVSAMAEAIAAKHGDASRAVLFYGSCLRQQELEGLMLDFYLIVSDYRDAYGKAWLASANRLIPPNVFYFEHRGLASKYAVLSEADFARFCSARAPDLSVMARFSQPSRLVWVADFAARLRIEAAVADAPAALAAITRPMLAEGAKGDRADLRDRAAGRTEGAPGQHRRARRSLLSEADRGTARLAASLRR